MGEKFFISQDTLQASTTETGNATGTVRLTTKTARAVEFWVIVTAISGTLKAIFETSLDGINFKEQGNIDAIATVDNFTLPLNRADDSLGTEVRVRWEVTGTVTFSVLMGTME